MSAEEMSSEKARFIDELVQPGGVIAVQKMELSRWAASRGDHRLCPVTTSETVAYIFKSMRDGALPEYGRMLQHPDFVSGALVREVVIAYYELPGTEPLVVLDPGQEGMHKYYDPVGAGRAHGELARFAADQDLTDPHHFLTFLAERDAAMFSERCNVEGLRDYLFQRFTFFRGF